MKLAIRNVTVNISDYQPSGNFKPNMVKLVLNKVYTNNSGNSKIIAFINRCASASWTNARPAFHWFDVVYVKDDGIVRSQSARKFAQRYFE